MRERAIEEKLVQAVRTEGGLAPKFTSPGFDGVPDRLVLLPGGRIAFIELKAPGKTLRLSLIHICRCCLPVSPS